MMLHSSLVPEAVATAPRCPWCHGAVAIVDALTESIECQCEDCGAYSWTEDTDTDKELGYND